MARQQQGGRGLKTGFNETFSQTAVFDAKFDSFDVVWIVNLLIKNLRSRP